jgi:PBSX family phage terminase large subunit
MPIAEFDDDGVYRLSLWGVQDDFVHDDKHRYQLMLCGRGAGKTVGMVAKTLRMCIQYPGIDGFLTAPDFRQMNTATLKEWFQIVPRELYDWSGSEMVATFKHLGYKGGSRVTFRTTTDPDQLRGGSLGFWGGDEASLYPREAYDVLVPAMRQVGYPQIIYLGTTPKGFNWIYDEFNDDQLKSLPNRVRYTATSYDNPYTNVEFLESLVIQYGGQDNSFYRQEILAEFTAHRGLVYPMFRDKLHVGDYPYDPGKPVILSVDFGFSAPYAVLAFQEDASGRVYCVDEIYKTQVNDDDMILLIKAKPYWGNISDCICDNQAPDRIKRLQDLGLPARPCKKLKHISEGLVKVREALAIDPMLKTPRLLINRSCVSLIDEFHKYAYSEPKEDRNAHETPIGAYDHALDACRYLYTTRDSRYAFAFDEVKPPPRKTMAYDKRR